MAAALNDRRLAQVAAAGVAFALVVVAASALLRLGTALDAGGNAASTLAAPLESFARLAHRICASIVGLLAIAAVFLAWRARPVPCPRPPVLVAIVVFTAVLAAIGRYTPGYRFLGVTVANAVLGIALATAFAWLYTLARGRMPASPVASLVVVAVVLIEIALGTAASAAAMHGRLAFEPLHVALGPAVAALAAWLAYRRRDALLAALAIAQLALGVALAAMGASRGMPGQWLHAMLASGLAIAIACDGPRLAPATRPGRRSGSGRHAPS